MRRETKKFKEGDDQVRIVNRIFSRQTDRNSPTFQLVKIELLRSIAENPEILLCELNSFEVLKVYHDGTSWVAESQATVYTDPNGR
jgi:hypothetical protein